jgi:hypothetical protein
MMKKMTKHIFQDPKISTLFIQNVKQTKRRKV